MAETLFRATWALALHLCPLWGSSLAAHQFGSLWHAAVLIYNNDTPLSLSVNSLGRCWWSQSKYKKVVWEPGYVISSGTLTGWVKSVSSSCSTRQGLKRASGPAKMCCICSCFAYPPGFCETFPWLNKSGSSRERLCCLYMFFSCSSITYL